MKNIIKIIKADPRYQKNIEFGEPRPGHPEGKVKLHIMDLEENLEALKLKGISTDDYWKLMLIIHVHDTFKAEAEKDAPTLHPKSHASLARKYTAQFIKDTDLLNMIQYHDENYKLWKQFKESGSIDVGRLESLLENIDDWDLFLMFIIIDGCTKGKDYSKLTWFINEVNKYKATKVDTSWILDP